MSAVVPAPLGAPQVASSDQIRVMVVDDAVVVRSLLSRWIDETPDLKLVAALRNGREALEQLDQARPDVVVLDIDNTKLNKDYKLRFESAVEDKEYYVKDLEIPLTTDGLSAKTEGKGYIRYVRFSPSSAN